MKLDPSSWRKKDHPPSLEVLWGCWRTFAVLVSPWPRFSQREQLSCELGEVHCVVHHPEIRTFNNPVCKPSAPCKMLPTVAGGTVGTGPLQSILSGKWLKNDRHYERLLIFMKRRKITFTRNCDPVWNERNMTCLFHSIKRVVKTIY